MENSSSLEGGGAESHPQHLDYGEPPDTNQPRLRGGGAQSGGGHNTFTLYIRNATERQLQNDDDLCKIPAAQFNAAMNGGGNARRQAVIQMASSSDAFDFNDMRQAIPRASDAFDFSDMRQSIPRVESEHTNPSFVAAEPPHIDRQQPEPALRIRRFADCHDPDLLAYLDSRAISRDFLAEIDQFLQGHPEIASIPEGRTALQEYYTLPPLEAYKHFVRGYILPARYIDGIIKTENFALPLKIVYNYPPLSTKHDDELSDFSSGFEFRHNVIDQIDRAVLAGMRDWVAHRHVPRPLRELICYALWGQPVDAYKFFEFSYQVEYMLHRCLPDHLILGHIPEPANYTVPQPEANYSPEKHVVRCRMAHAYNQGMDGRQVLVMTYHAALIGRGFQRFEIDQFVREAWQYVNLVREIPSGADIVDLIMDDVENREPARGPYDQGRHSRYQDVRRVDPHVTVRYHGRGRNIAQTPKVPKHLQAEATELQQARANLDRMYAQERRFFPDVRLVLTNPSEESVRLVRSARASAELRYVTSLSRYLRDTNQISSTQANQLQSEFRHLIWSDQQVSQRQRLMDMFPDELL